MEPYLMLDINRYIWFRFVISDIFVLCIRCRSDVTVLEMVCPFCKISVQNEVHFVLCCPGFDDLRRRYIQPKYFNLPTDFF